MTALRNLEGQRFGSLVVTGRTSNMYGTGACWTVKCDCGKSKDVAAASLVRGLTTTCGIGGCRYRTKPLQQQFDRYAIPEPNSGCTLWLGSCDRRNYGELRVAGRNMRATHVALQLAGTPVPKGMFACHRCDNPNCVNADHLFIGSAADNAADMIGKNRHDHSGLELGRGSRNAAL